MTLGLTSAGAVKIKMNGDAGLRAVECACCGCASFAVLTGVTSITLYHSPENAQTVSAVLNMQHPFTNYEHFIEDGMLGSQVSADSSNIGASILQSAYGFNFYASVYIIKQNGVCVATISSGSNGGNGSDFYAVRSGSITVPVANIFGAHDIFETGEACSQELGAWDEELGMYDIITTCTPTSSTSTVTIIPN